MHLFNEIQARLLRAKKRRGGEAVGGGIGSRVWDKVLDNHSDDLIQFVDVSAARIPQGT